MATMDVFKADGFSLMELTNTINKTPFIPGQAGKLIDWTEKSIRGKLIGIEEKEGP